MLYLGCIVGIILVYCIRKAKKIGDTKKKITEMKVIIFLLGIMILADIGEGKLFILGKVGDIAFIVLIILLAYGLFRKLFMR